MGIPKHKQTLSIDEYLAGERDVEIRHEYVTGYVYAMAGASNRHNRIAGNLYIRLDEHLADGPCAPYISDMKVKVSESVVYYPDVVVACDNPWKDPYYCTHPVLVVEVLSPSTQRIDQNEKLAAYQNMPCIRDYLIVAQDQMRIDWHHRLENGDWAHDMFTQSEEQFELGSVGLTLSVADVYRNIRFEEVQSI